jgi:transcriptional regulator of arginine metabolism
VSAARVTIQRAPHTMQARRSRIAALISSREITSQEELGSLLAAEGMTVTQATLSRDLDALGAVKLTGKAGAHYVVSASQDTSLHTSGAEAALARVTAELLIRAEAAGNTLVLQTPPGAAQFYAGHLDRTDHPGVVGSVAGDDTIIVVMRTPAAATRLCTSLLRMAEQRRVQ